VAKGLGALLEGDLGEVSQELALHHAGVLTSCYPLGRNRFSGADELEADDIEVGREARQDLTRHVL